MPQVRISRWQNAPDPSPVPEIAVVDTQRPAPNEMDKLSNLPEELLVHMFGYLETSDLCNLRLVSTRVTGPAAVCCFRDLNTTVFEDDRFLFPVSKLHSSPVAQKVRAVHINPGRVDELQGANARDWVLGQLGFALDRACKFPYLRKLSLTLCSFDCISNWNEYHSYVEGGSSEDTPFNILLMLFKATANRALEVDRSTTIRELELYGVPPLHRPKLLKDSRFEKGICAAQELTLHFGKWCPKPAHRTTHPRKDFPSSKAPHDFAATLIKWLVFGKDTRKKLDLAFDDYIGYHPKFWLRDIHFPWLKALSLRNVTFTHDVQIKWITDHSDTLETLRLHNCPIIVEISTNMELDKDRFPIPHEAAGELTKARNKMLWNDVLDTFRTGLGSLCEFHVSFLRLADGIEDPDRGMTAGRYKTYAQGQILISAYTKQVHEDQLSKDTQAFIRLLQHTGQWNSGARLLVEDEEEDLIDTEIVD